MASSLAADHNQPGTTAPTIAGDKVHISPGDKVHISPGDNVRVE